MLSHIKCQSHFGGGEVNLRKLDDVDDSQQNGLIKI